MNFIFLLLIIAFINLALGLFVLLKDFLKPLNRLFFIFSFLTGIWILTNFLTGIQPTLFWLKNTYAFGATIPISAVSWILLLCKEKLTRLKFFIFFGLGFSFFILSYFNELIVVDVTKIYLGGYEGRPGVLFPFYSLYIFGTLIFIIYKLFISYIKTKGETKNQLGYVLIGVVFWGAIATTVSFILPLFGIMKFIPLDSPSTVIFLIFTTLAITRYHLFEIKVILTELLVGAMAILLLINFFISQTSLDYLWKGSVFLLFLIFAYYLIKATHQESKRREEAEKLTLQERTLRKKAEKVAKEFERISNIKDQMLLSSQHYWRTPLTGMKGFLDMILTGDYGELSPALKEKLVIIQKLSQTLHQRIEESIDITQFQIGKGMLNKEETQIEDFLNGILEEFKPQLEERRLYLKTQFPKEKLPKIEIDQKRMRETYSNVIDNAIKHTKKGGITIILEFKPHGLKLNQPSILCLVKDTGIGISKEELLSIGTSPFERGEEAKKLSPMGKGIGLYLSRLIVEAHGGKLWIESEGKDKGTTIYIELPIK